LTVLATNTISLTGPSAVFFGYSDPGGIGSVEFAASDPDGFSPVIDNVEFGVSMHAVPEPASVVSFVSGTLATLVAFGRHRRRRWASGGSHRMQVAAQSQGNG
jgi:hypothetical protein